jgi:hypothetical protein
MFGGRTFVIVEAELQKRPPKLGPGGEPNAKDAFHPPGPRLRLRLDLTVA